MMGTQKYGIKSHRMPFPPRKIMPGSKQNHERATNHHAFTTISPRFTHQKIALLAAKSPKKPAKNRN
jgi:hypothetical protein